MADELFRAKAPPIMHRLISDLEIGDEEAAAILGNIAVETGGFTLMQEKRPLSGRGGWGWVQWTGERRRQFEAWVKSSGLDPSSDEANYGYLLYELTKTPEKRAIPKLKAAGGVEAKTLSFMKTFERPGIPHEDRRIAYAKLALQLYREIGMITEAAPSSPTEPPWLTEARKLVGLKEIVGSQHEAKVVQFFSEAGHPEVHDDETAWCAAFANAMLRRAGYKGTGKLNARSFMDWGDELKQPRIGCIAVFKRGSSEWQGHVAFYVGEDASRVKVLGGNQGNSVSITTMPKSSLLGYRWPAGASSVAQAKKPLPDTPKPPAKQDVGTVGILGGIGLGLVAAWNWFTDHLLAISLGIIIVAIVGLVIYRLVKGHWPWTSHSIGARLQGLSPQSPQKSVPSLGPPSGPPLRQDLALELEAASAKLRAVQSPRGSGSKQRRKRSAKPSRTTRKPRKSSKRSNASVATRSSPKRKPKSSATARSAKPSARTSRK